MKSDLTISNARTTAQKTVNSKRATPQQTGNSLWAFVNSVANGFKEYIGHPIAEFAKSVGAWAKSHEYLLFGVWGVAYHLAVWVINDVERRIVSLILHYIDQLKAWTFKQLQDVYFILAVAVTTLRAQLVMALKAETRARIKAVAHAEALAKREVTALHQAIEREAATAYQSGNPGHLAAVSILGDAIGALEPALNRVVSRVIRYAVDLAEIDNPVIRFLAGKLISYLIAKLGVDKVAGEMLASLVNPVTHMGAPKGLPDVVTMLCGRLNALEQFNATFMADGGPEILRAGEQWRSETTISAGVALLAFFGSAVAEPDAWATAVADTIQVVIYDTASAVSKLIKG